jgi:hypothetical protein
VKHCGGAAPPAWAFVVGTVSAADAFCGIISVGAAVALPAFSLSCTICASMSLIFGQAWNSTSQSFQFSIFFPFFLGGKKKIAVRLVMRQQP